MNNEDKPIGFFDSGIGGISVLREAVKLLPMENYIYFGDSKNAPYGVKKVSEVKLLTFDAVNFLLEKRAKAIVIACNTATSAAIEDLRKKYKKVPIIGIEPALKPAVTLGRKGKIIIMATPMSLAEEKFRGLMKKYEAKADIEPLPCAGLVEFIESGIFEGEQINNYLSEKFKPFENNIAAVVLGCTHYPFIKNSLIRLLNKEIPIIDGSIGTARQLRCQLVKYNMLNQGKEKGKTIIYNSFENDKIKKLSYHLLNV